MERSMLSAENIEPLLPTPVIQATLCKVHKQWSVFTLDSGLQNLPADRTSALSSKYSMALHPSKGVHPAIQRLSHVT